MNLANLFDQGQNLPNIPKIVQELIETFNKSDFDMDEIAKKISLDPVLTAKVLRLANCAHYGVSRTISSTTDASVLLGFSTLRTLVLASGITGAMQSPAGFNRKEFWRDNFLRHSPIIHLLILVLLTHVTLLLYIIYPRHLFCLQYWLTSLRFYYSRTSLGSCALLANVTYCFYIIVSRHYETFFFYSASHRVALFIIYTINSLLTRHAIHSPFCFRWRRPVDLILGHRLQVPKASCLA